VVAEAANTYVAILSGTAYNAYGDVIDAATEVTSNIPAILIETSKMVQDPVTQTPRTVRSATLKLPYYVDVDDGNQIRDQVTGNVYAIIDITRPPTLTGMPVAGPPDWLLTLRRVTSQQP
jgi:hypothetical protein